LDVESNIFSAKAQVSLKSQRSILTKCK